MRPARRSAPAGTASRSRRRTICAGAPRSSSSSPRACFSSRAARRGGAPTSTPSPPRSIRSTLPRRESCRRRFGSATPSCSPSSTARRRARWTHGTHSSRVPPPRWAAAAATSSPSSRGASPSPLRVSRRDGNRFTLELVSQLAVVDYDETALLEELRARRPGETGRGLSLFGPHRDDVRFLEVGTRRAAGDPDDDEAAAGGRLRRSGRRRHGPVCGPIDLPRGGRDLRLFGSQGEQRAAVLALLLAEQQLAAARTGEQGTLFLDDVMSELDDARRRLLVRHARFRRPGDHHDHQPPLLHGGGAGASHRDRAAAGRLAGGWGRRGPDRGRAGVTRDGRRCERSRAREAATLAAASPGAWGTSWARRWAVWPRAIRDAPTPPGRAPPASRWPAAPGRATSRAACSPWSAPHRCGPTTSPFWAARSSSAWTRSRPGTRWSAFVSWWNAARRDRKRRLPQKKTNACRRRPRRTDLDGARAQAEAVC